MAFPDYTQMLTEAKEQLPEVEENAERFQIPKVKGHLQGVRTIITNLNQIANILHRPLKHIIKFLTKELAAGAEQVKQLVMFNAKIPATRINEKLKAYVDLFVLCKECSKPDTKLNKEGDIYYMKCQACGARQTFTAKI